MVLSLSSLTWVLPQFFLAGIVHDKYGGDYRFKNPGILLQPGTTEPFELETLPVFRIRKG